MKNVKILSLGIAMLICFVTKAQEKIVSENNPLQTEIKAKSFTKSKDTIADVKASSNFIQPATSPARIVICAPSRFSEPLTILDGVVITSKQFSKVNPNDIQDIKVLKGTEATSLYGNQGKNGVIVITTKKKYNQNNNEE
jgi:TonB-dependent SusC/RagA subfamily outer membrane receptor